MAQRRQHRGPEGSRRDHRRIMLAQAAAKLIVEHGMDDYHAAKVRAADSLGLTHAGALPTNAELEHAVAEYQRIFHPDAHREWVRTLRDVALAALSELSDFSPRVVLDTIGNAGDVRGAIRLFAFHEPSEAVGSHLANLGYAVEAGQRRFRFSKGEARVVPSYLYRREDIDIEVCVFPYRGRSQQPRSGPQQRPIKTASRYDLVNGDAP